MADVEERDVVVVVEAVGAPFAGVAVVRADAELAAVDVRADAELAAVDDDFTSTLETGGYMIVMCQLLQIGCGCDCDERSGQTTRRQRGRGRDCCNDGRRGHVSMLAARRFLRRPACGASTGGERAAEKNRSPRKS